MAKDAFGRAAHAIIAQFIHAKLPADLMKLVDQAQLDQGTEEQNVTYLEKEPELNGLEVPDELHVNTGFRMPPTRLPTDADCRATTWENLDITEIKVAD